MPMPTTRRGRFLLYKARQRNRLRRVYQKKDKWYGVVPVLGVRPTNRYRIWDGHTKQMPREFPQHFPEKSLSAEQWMLYGWEPPKRGAWGVVRAGLGIGGPPPWPFQGNGAYIGYYDRRVLSIPRLKHLPWSGYHPETDPNVKECCYPFYRYPSGRISWAGMMGWVTP